MQLAQSSLTTGLAMTTVIGRMLLPSWPAPIRRAYIPAELDLLRTAIMVHGRQALSHRHGRASTRPSPQPLLPPPVAPPWRSRASGMAGSKPGHDGGGIIGRPEFSPIGQGVVMFGVVSPALAVFTLGAFALP